MNSHRKWKVEQASSKFGGVHSSQNIKNNVCAVCSFVSILAEEQGQCTVGCRVFLFWSEHGGHVTVRNGAGISEGD